MFKWSAGGIEEVAQIVFPRCIDEGLRWWQLRSDFDTINRRSCGCSHGRETPETSRAPVPKESKRSSFCRAARDSEVSPQNDYGTWQGHCRAQERQGSLTVRSACQNSRDRPASSSCGHPACVFVGLPCLEKVNAWGLVGPRVDGPCRPVLGDLDGRPNE